LRDRIAGWVWFWLDSLPQDAKWLRPEESQALNACIEEEQRQREAATGKPVKHSVLNLLLDPQIVLFCFLYFSVALTIYGATFWLPSIIQEMGDINDFEVGLFNSIPWIIAVVAMYIFASLAARFKWQQAWADQKAFEAPDDDARPTYYVLEMFPYPSGLLHMGHVRNYTLGDVVARYKMAKGFNVMHPMGWDAFGLPAENAAITKGIHPAQSTYGNIAAMSEQFASLGLSLDSDEGSRSGS